MKSYVIFSQQIRISEQQLGVVTTELGLSRNKSFSAILGQKQIFECYPQSKITGICLAQ
jgi:hypothetical protein